MPTTIFQPDVLLGVATSILALFLIQKAFQARQRLPLPPGPRPWPVFGNITDMPPRGHVEWKHWLRHKDLYGPLSSVTALGKTLVLIHDKEAALELLEKRAATHSGRPTATFAMDMCGLDKIIGTQQPGPTLHLCRKLAMSQLGSQAAVLRFDGLQEFSTQTFLARLLDSSDPDLQGAIKSMMAEMLLKIIYGYHVEQSGPDPLIALNDRLVDIFASVTLPGAWLVDIIPWLKYLPDWMPGTGFKSVARKARLVITAAADVPFQFAKQRASAGDSSQAPPEPEPSLVGELLRAGQGDGGVSADDIRWTAVTLYGAGVDTTGSALRAFFLAMSVFPDVQARARGEIDAVVGRARLPRHGDRAKLPYVNAVVKEALRWLPSAPLGVPHAAQAEDELRGFRIPRGAVLMHSTWWFAHDPAVYHDPDAFLPERYMAPFEEPDPAGFVFGFGRRICPGRRLADSTLFLAVSKVLATFEIRKGIDSQGGEIEPEVGVGPGAVAGPLPFSVRLEPRNQDLTRAIRSELADLTAPEGDARYLGRGIYDLLK